MRRRYAGRDALRQVHAHALESKRRGAARTHDHVMMDSLGAYSEPRKKRRHLWQGSKGGAQWKKHASEALCKAAFTNEHASFATKAVEGSSKSQAQTATWAMAEVITRASEQDTDNLKRPLA